MWSMAALSVGLVTPSLVLFCVHVFAGGIAPLSSARRVWENQFVGGHGLIEALGLIPFVLLSAVCFIAARRIQGARLACVTGGGLIGILAFMIPAHASIWLPLYGPGHMSSTAVAAFLFIPFFCLGTLLPGLFAGWLVSLGFKGRSGGR